MKFEVSETITTNAAKNEILTALSKQFQKVSKSLINHDGYLEAKYIEASFGSINRVDITTIRVQEKNGGYLLIADVSYKPSISFWMIFVIGILLWGIGPIIAMIFFFYQKNTVRKSIQNVFLRVKNEFQDLSSVQIAATKPAINSLDQLEKLHDLKVKGIISEEEFLTEKKKYLTT